MTQWPAIITHEGQDEVSYVGNAASWQELAQDPHLFGAGNDTLIDSNGDCFELVYDSTDKSLHILATHRQIDLRELAAIVKGHLTTRNQCCISKLQVQSVEEGMQLIADTED
jgi:hypothetical protein